jgi:hypothetical protein
VKRPINFYRGLSLLIEDIDNNTVIVKDKFGNSVMLSTNLNPNTELLAESVITPKVNDTLIYFQTNEILNLLEHLRLNNIKIVKNNYLWEESLIFQDVDGYRILIKQRKELSHEQILSIYKEGVVKIKKIMNSKNSKLYDINLDDKWTIREEFHHLVERDLNSLFLIKTALAEPGKKYNPTFYDADLWLESLKYNSLPIETSLKLFELIRTYVLELINSLNRLQEGHLLINGKKVTLIEKIRDLATHSLEHILNIEKKINKLSGEY